MTNQSTNQGANEAPLIEEVRRSIAGMDRKQAQITAAALLLSAQNQRASQQLARQRERAALEAQRAKASPAAADAGLSEEVRRSIAGMNRRDAQVAAAAILARHINGF